MLCNNIVELCAHGNKHITTCAPFAKTLKILNISFTCGITDAGLRECHSITKLVAAHTNNITTCDPFAKTLVYLNIICNNSMTDDSLRLCTNIKTLFVNEKITTCAPFAASLVELYADSQLRHAKVLLSDKGIATCENIRMLTIVNNDNITSYAPFIKSLRHVYASNDDIKYDKKMYPQIMVEIRKR